MTIVVPTQRDVQTTLNYYQPQDQSPYYCVGGRLPKDVPVHNVCHEPHTCTIHDARDKQDAFGLDTSGFQWIHHPSVAKEFVDQERIKTVYYPEVEDLLKKHAGAKRVLIYKHTIRRSQDPETNMAKLSRARDRGPLHCVHVDHTPDFAAQKIRACLQDEAERLLEGRCRIINVWRPIANTVAHNPLGVVDFRTVDVDADLVPVRLIFPKCEGEVYNVKRNPGHKWYYLSDQTPDEVVLFKCFDSDTDKASLVPHSAFADKTSSSDAPQRQSIEVRALVFDRE